MIVEVINVGTELLRGSTVNTNASYISEECTKLGLYVKYQSVVGDEEDALEEAIRLAGGRSDIIILSGGLGPTGDDVTKEAAAKVLGKDLVDDKLARKNITEYFKKRGVKEVPENNRKQAEILEGATVLYNDNGTAPGMMVEEKAGKRYIFLPGPPNELVPMFEEYVSPYLQKLGNDVLATKTVKICGMGESKVEKEIRSLFKKKTEALITTYAKPGEVHVCITAKGKDKKAAEKVIKPIIKEISKHFGNKAYTMDAKETLEECIVKRLSKKGLTLSTAESCTGGLFAGRIINVPGASNVLGQGYITYSNKSKRKLLGVSKDTLKKYGAVSKQTAKEMAKNTALGSDSDVAVAITGIAGPDGGSSDKPVGLVFIACYYDGNTTVKEYRFVGNREKIRTDAVAAALCLLRDCVITNE